MTNSNPISFPLSDAHNDRLQHLINEMEPWQDKFTLQYDQLNILKKRYLGKLARFSKDEQTLNIAIMGQVKAGKSSFLNALLFDGKPVLPEASTPKTANLTRISYAASPRLEVEFYSPKDWARITELAQSNFDHQEAKMAKEQMGMLAQAGIDVDALISQGTKVHATDDLDTVMNVLNDYAGNDGKYTGLVRMIRLYLPLPELAGYNIIDTPGMNDPVISRTQRTREEMANSDVVFFLSRASNFLDASDIDLLSKQLPEAGVKRLVLVAGQYDSAIEQDGFDRDSLQATEKNLYQRIVKRAQLDIARLANDKEQIGMTNVANILRSMTKPFCSSTYAYGFANWDKDKWNKNMSHTHKNITELAQNEWNQTINQQDWQRIAGFEPLQQEYEQAKIDKEHIITEQKNSLLPEAEMNLQNWLDEFTEQINQRITTLKQDDLSDIEKKQHQYQSKISEISTKLEDVISNSIDDAKTRQTNISYDLKKRISKHTNLKSRTSTESNIEEYTVEHESSLQKFGRFLSFGLYDGRTSETRYRTITNNYEYLSTTDAIDQLNNYAHECESDISHSFSLLVNPNDIKVKLKKSLISSLDTKSESFDPTQFRDLMSRSIRQLDIPELSLNIGNISNMIDSSFDIESRTESDKVRLKQQLDNALCAIFEKLNSDFVHSVSQVTVSLETLHSNLEFSLTETLQTELNQLKKDIKDKQDMIKSYKLLISKVLI